MHPRSSSRLVLRIGGWFLCLLALLVIYRLWTPDHYPPAQEGPPISSEEVARDGDRVSPEPHAAASLTTTPVSPALAAVAPQSLSGKTAQDALEASGQYASLGAALHAARHAMERIDPSDPHSRGAGYFAANPRQQLRAWFFPDGAELASGLAPADPTATPWRLALRLRSAGRAEAMEPVANTKVAADGDVLTMTGDARGVSQWFVNARAGLEQGFTIAERPPGSSGEVAVVMTVDSGLRPAWRSPETVAFVDAAGADVLHYEKLLAWDTAGRTLPARMEVRGAEVALLVADAGAQYPVTIDPLFANVEARLQERSVSGDHFGTSVALSGDTAIVGADKDDALAGVEVGSVYVFVRTAGTWRQQAKLTPGSIRDFERAGFSVAIDGDTAVLGTPFARRPSGPDKGSAYVFVRSGTTWTEQQRLPLTDGGAGDGFGGAVAISGTTVLVGAFNADPSNIDDAGSGYVFLRTGSTWAVQGGPLTVAGGPFDNLGAAVALRGDTALLGAPGSDTRAFNAGAAYVFQRTGTNWAQQGPALTAPDGEEEDSFGQSVALSGETAVIGADGVDLPGATDAGAAYAFVRSAGVWAPQGPPLTAGDALAGDHLGYAIALSGDTAVVGAHLDDETLEKPDVGSARVFVRSGGVWTEQAPLLPAERHESANFGAAVAIEGDTALVGAFFDRTSAGPEAGSAQVFLRTAGVWNRQALLTTGDTPNFDRFGMAVAFVPGIAVVGSEFDDTTAGANAGTAYVFSQVGTQWFQQARLTASDGAEFTEFGGSVAISGTSILVGAEFATTAGGNSAGAAYVFVRQGAVWNQQARLVAPDGTGFDNFGSAVAISSETALVGAKGEATLAGSRAGAGYVFIRSGSAWTFQKKLEAGGGPPGALFGSAVSLVGETALIGAPDDETRPGVGPGAAYVFVRSGVNWGLPMPVTAGDGGAADLFGASVSLGSDTVLIGAPGDNTGAGADAGSAYVFVRTGGSWTFQSKLSPIGAGNGSRFGHAVAVSGDLALIGSPLANTTAGNDAGTASLFSRRGGQWSQGARLTAGIDASEGDEFGSGVALGGNTALVGARKEGTIGQEAGGAYFFTVGELPEIIVQPVSRTVVPGANVNFSVTATGFDLRYQWRKNGVEIQGQTTPSLALFAVAEPDAGNYDVIVSNVGGIVTSAVAVLTVNNLSEFGQQSVPVVAEPDRQGFLIVNLLPAGLSGAQWRFVGEQQWRASGVPVFGLPTSDRVVEFRPVPGYQQPLPDLVSVISGVATPALEREYLLLSGAGATGDLFVLLKPGPPAGAQWRLLGEDDSQWRNSGTTRSGLFPGAYLVECKPVTGRSTPPPIAVQVEAGETSTAVGTYFLTATQAGMAPGIVPFDIIAASPNLPYQYVGQVRSEVSSGTGFVVRPRVVATAGHVVFDDGTLAAVSDLQWLLQRDKGTYEPKPQIPRGFFLMTGYAARRTLEATPGESLPESYDLDVAALYFTGVLAPDGSLLDDGFPGRGGFSGFLASDATPNEWLTSDALKTLVGYPNAGLTLPNQGRMHATPPANLLFSPSFGRVYVNNTTDLTRRIHSFGGNSGGPLCVQFEGGAYYPAGIFLSSAGQTVIRAIDSSAITLFELARIAGDGGPQSGDGGSTRTSTALTGSTTAPGSVKVTLQPSVAAIASGGWRFGSSTTLRPSGNPAFQPLVGPGTYQVYYVPVSGFITPGTARTTPVVGNATQFTLTNGVETRIVATYHGIVGHPSSQTKLPGSSVAFRVDIGYTPAPPQEPAPSYQWQQRATTTGATFVNVTGANAATYSISGLGPVHAGEYRAIVTWANGTRTSNPATLTVTGDTLDSWRAARFTAAELANPQISGPLADPGRDGVNVLLAFALNLDPKTSDSRNMIPGTGTLGLPAVSQLLVSGQRRLALEFVRRRVASAPGITYRVEFTGTLSASTLWSATGTEAVTPIDSTWERVVVTDSQPANPRRFGRLVVTQP